MSAPADILDAELVDEQELERATKTPATLFADVADAGGRVARALGADDAADVARDVAKVARTAPATIAALDRETKPLRKAFGDLWASAEKAGFVHRRPPREPSDG